jgi:hypothetical protein
MTAGLPTLALDLSRMSLPGSFARSYVFRMRAE